MLRLANEPLRKMYGLYKEEACKRVYQRRQALR
jgi:hypothetical protein